MLMLMLAALIRFRLMLLRRQVSGMKRFATPLRHAAITIHYQLPAFDIFAADIANMLKMLLLMVADADY